MLTDGSRVIALIPARGGSKGILRKNLANLAGSPLIKYTIDSARRSSLVDEVWVSSDDEEILNVSESLGVRVLNRPKEISDDKSSAEDVVYHFISTLSYDAKYENIVIIYLQPTSPLRDHEHINSALEIMTSQKAIGVMSVVEAEKSPYKSFRISESGQLLSLFDERLSNARRQDLPKCYYPNGAIYAFRLFEFIKRKGFPSNGSFPFVMSTSESIDIDDGIDLIKAETVIGDKNGGV